MASEVVWDSAELVGRIKSITPKMEAFLFASASYHATRATRFARRNAPWTDRTSNARNGLNSKAFKGGRYGFVTYGTVTYQPYLEVRWSGRYAIIGPTIKQEGPAFMKTVSQGFSQIFGV